MGLDNGIVVKAAENELVLNALAPYRKSLSDEIEICYWRKCWNIRNEILNMLGKRFSEEWRHELTERDVDGILIILDSYTEENWNDSGGSIWEYAEMAESLAEQKNALMLLKRLMCDFGVSAYFYDSY